MKNKDRFIIMATAIGLAVIFTSCDQFDDNEINKSSATEECSQQNLSESTNCDFTTTLTDTEIAYLLHMREEEKVARDVYLKFYDMYNMPIFNNIAQSEQRHMDAVLSLIKGYGLTDPVADKGIGEFTTTFQSLYDELIVMGSTITESFKVGVQIEELDIADLEKCIASTEVSNIIRVYNNLLAGSKNHLAAFRSKI